MKKKKLLIVAAAVLAAGAAALSRGLDIFPQREVPPYRTFGPEEAPVKVAEYSDLSCPACAAAWTGLEETARKYPKYLRVEFKHYPLASVHRWSFDAALYADCAGQQGRFKEYAGLLFTNQKDWSRAENAPEQFGRYADLAGLERGALDACLAAPETAEAVRLDMAEGDRRKIGSTPTFFVNGKRFVGPAQLMRQLQYLAITVKPENL